ncbi:hypothetical protein GY45DRAFT_1292590 [Cubamyces sp. BRFM 1775]|nr:hypothetical protein GY45DRAFT_1292590 [Cubamyces sp. BRFM 1775]
MGGNAFKAVILAENAAFPRMPPQVYNALKAALQPILQKLYTYAVVPHEAPEKADHGDLDFVVCGPRASQLTRDEVKAALRAAHSVPMEGNRTSNFAIPANAFEDVARACRECADESLRAAVVYFQVDVNVCGDHAQWERTVFCHSYGDLGLILGLLVQTAGLSLSVYGLRLIEPIGTPPQTFYVSTSMSDVLDFLGLSMERWKRGFTSEAEIFDWVTSSPFAMALAERLKAKDDGSDASPSGKDRGEGRAMRQNFIALLQSYEFPEEVQSSVGSSVFATWGNRREKLEATLKHFGKDKEYAAILNAAQAAVRAKAVLNGKNVQEWTGIMGMPARYILDEMKERLAKLQLGSEPDGDAVASSVVREIPAWQYPLLEMSDEEVRELMVKVKEDLDAAGKLEYDWRAAKAAKLARKRQAELAAGTMDDQVAVAVEA